MKIELIPSAQTKSVPSRPPDFRWRRAQYLATNDLASDAEDHPTKLAIQALQVLLLRQACYPAIKESVDLIVAVRRLEQGIPRWSRLEVRCRILSRQSDAEVAEFTRIAEPVICLYRLLFFDLRLNSPGAVQAYFHDQIGPESYALQSCYHFGPEVVDGWLDYLRHEHESHDLSTEIGRRRERFAINLLSKELLDIELSEAQKRRFIAGVERLETPVKTTSSASVFHSQAAVAARKLAWNIAGNRHPRWSDDDCNADPICELLNRDVEARQATGKSTA